jgi:hypothetical protein
MKKLSRMLVALAIVIGAAYTSASAATVYTIVVGVDSNGTPTVSQDLVTLSFADGRKRRPCIELNRANFTSSGGAVSSGALTVNFFRFAACYERVIIAPATPSSAVSIRLRPRCR